jgi:RND family efflux transporter MFP subunit
MSPSMFLGRIVLPAAGLLIAGALAWQTLHTGRVELPSWLSFGSASSGERPRIKVEKASIADSPKRVIAEGRVVPYPGAQVVIGAETAGTISRVLVEEKTHVRKGDLLVEFKVDDLKTQVDEAEARLVEAENEVVRLENDERRLSALAASSPSSRPQLEQNHYLVVAYRARRDAMKAARARLDVFVKKCRVVAPIDGVVTARFVQPGETVSMAAPLVTVVDLRRLRVEAEVDEYDVAGCTVGDHVLIRTEAYPGRNWQGAVEEVSDALVGRRIRPEDPGRPTDTRVLPVRIAFRDGNPLRLGQRVEVEIVDRPAPVIPAAPALSVRPAASPSSKGIAR